MIARLLLALALVGCAQGTPLEPLRAPLRVDPAEWSDSKLADIASAVEAWQAFAPGRVSLELVEPGEPANVRPALLEGAGAGHYLAEQIQLDPRVSRLRVVAMHEIGHALNLGHVDGDGVMSAEVSSDTFTALDLAECIRAGVCLRGTLLP